MSEGRQSRVTSHACVNYHIIPCTLAASLRSLVILVRLLTLLTLLTLLCVLSSHNAASRFMFMCMRSYISAMKLLEPLQARPLLGHDFVRPAEGDSSSDSSSDSNSDSDKDQKSELHVV